MGPWGMEFPLPHGPDEFANSMHCYSDPGAALWGVAVLTPLLRHPSHEACLAELRRNPVLRRLVGIEAEEQVPHHSYPKRSRTADGI
jgi:Transposase domain (DUF772)